jgi:hypothetical protein
MQMNWSSQSEKHTVWQPRRNKSAYTYKQEPPNWKEYMFKSRAKYGLAFKASPHYKHL